MRIGLKKPYSDYCRKLKKVREKKLQEELIKYRTEYYDALLWIEKAIKDSLGENEYYFKLSWFHSSEEKDHAYAILHNKKLFPQGSDGEYYITEKGIKKLAKLIEKENILINKEVKKSNDRN